MHKDQLNLSLENAVDDSFYALISEVIKFGQKFLASNPLTLSSKVSRTTFIKNHISIGNEIFEETLAK